MSDVIQRTSRQPLCFPSERLSRILITGSHYRKRERKRDGETRKSRGEESEEKEEEKEEEKSKETEKKRRQRMERIIPDN